MCEINVLFFRAVDKGCLKGFFSLEIPELSMEINDCRYFEKEDKAWISLPTREGKSKDGTKTEFWPVVKVKNRELWDTIQDKAISLIKNWSSNGKSKSYQRAQDTLSGSPSTPW
jgi:hypothetical protein